MESKSASCRGESQSRSPARSSTPTRAVTCERNCRTLEPHQEREERIDDRADDPRPDRHPERGQDEEDEHEQDESVLLEYRPPAPRDLRREEGEQDLRAVERWDREEVEDHQHEVDDHEQVED